MSKVYGYLECALCGHEIEGPNKEEDLLYTTNYNGDSLGPLCDVCYETHEWSEIYNDYRRSQERGSS